MTEYKIAIQGYPGSFHDEAANRYWNKTEIKVVPADNFDILGRMVQEGAVDAGIMAIENSIAGTILQNYRILREKKLWVSGEIYLRIRHHLLANPESSIDSIKEVESHPMAINQCRKFLSRYPDWKLIESDDTALSAEQLSKSGSRSKACIASHSAAELYQLKFLAEGIETHSTNYTRFFILRCQRQSDYHDVNKASVYIQIPDRKGQLLKVLEHIHLHDINMSKLQSFPVTGSFREYYFHLDLEFDNPAQYFNLKESLKQLNFGFEELGLYKRAEIETNMNLQIINAESV